MVLSRWTIPNTTRRTKDIDYSDTVFLSRAKYKTHMARRRLVVYRTRNNVFNNYATGSRRSHTNKLSLPNDKEDK